MCMERGLVAFVRLAVSWCGGRRNCLLGVS